MRCSITFLLLSVACAASAQSFTFAAAHQFSPGIDGWLNGVTMDPAGNTVVVGSYTGDADLDPGPGTYAPALPDGSFFYGFVAKYGPDGSLSWAIPLGWGLVDIKVDGAGDIYVCGYHEANGDLDPGPGIVGFDVGDESGGFVAKLSPDAELIWAYGMTRDNGYSFGMGPLTLAPDGGVLVSGSWSGNGGSGTMDLAPGTGAATLISAACPECSDAFLLRLDPAGDYLWHRHLRVSEPAQGSSVSVADLAMDAAGASYIVGGIHGVVDLHPGPPIVELSSSSSTSYLLKLDANGAFSHVLPFGGANAVSMYRVEAGQDGRIYVGGWFQGTTDLDPGPGVDQVTSISGGDGIMASFAPDGTYQWGRPFGATGGQSVLSLAAPDNGGIRLALSSSEGAVDLDPGPATVPTTTNECVAVVQLDSDGQYAGSGILNTLAGYNGAIGMAITPEGGALLAGIFDWAVDCDPNEDVWQLQSESDLAGYLVRWAAGTVGVAEAPMLSFEVFPNPATDKLYLRGTASGLLSIDVLNGLGQRVRHLERFDPQRDAIDLTGLPAGMLMLDLTSSAARTSLRVVHQP